MSNALTFFFFFFVAWFSYVSVRPGIIGAGQASAAQTRVIAVTGMFRLSGRSRAFRLLGRRGLQRLR